MVDPLSGTDSRDFFGMIKRKRKISSGKGIGLSKGARQYFTARILIQLIVQCMKPDPRKRADVTISDPGSGTGGFLVCSYEWLLEQSKGGALDRDVALRMKKGTYIGQELVDRSRRLALINQFLPNVEPSIIQYGDSIYENPDRGRTATTERVAAGRQCERG